MFLKLIQLLLQEINIAMQQQRTIDWLKVNS